MLTATICRSLCCTLRNLLCHPRLGSTTSASCILCLIDHAACPHPTTGCERTLGKVNGSRDRRMCSTDSLTRPCCASRTATSSASHHSRRFQSMTPRGARRLRHKRRRQRCPANLTPLLRSPRRRQSKVAGATTASLYAATVRRLRPRSGGATARVDCFAMHVASLSRSRAAHDR